MTRLVAILIALFLVAIPAKADVALWPSPVPGWTVIQVSGEIKVDDVATFESYTENVDPAATLVIVTGPGGDLSAGINIGLRVHVKKLIVGVMGKCTSSCALIWIGGEIDRKFLYQPRPGAPFTLLCFHQASENPVWDLSGPMGLPPSASGNAFIGEYLTKLGYNQDVIEWATAADPKHHRCLTPELAKNFKIDFWYNTEDGQHYTLPGDHGLLPTTSAAAKNDSDFPQQMAAIIYNTSASDLQELTQAVGRCNNRESYVAVKRGAFETRRPISCDKGALLQGTGNRGHVAFGYRDNAIWFGGVYDKDTNSIVINQLFWPNVDAEPKAIFHHGLPSDTDHPDPIDAVKKAAINGVIDNHLEGKCFNRAGYVSCRARYKNVDEFFMSFRISYEKLTNVTLPGGHGLLPATSDPPPNIPHEAVPFATPDPSWVLAPPNILPNPYQ